MPQSVAAARAGIDRTSWGRIEAGKLDIRLDTLLRIQFALGVDTLEALFGDTTGDLFGRGAEEIKDPLMSGRGEAEAARVNQRR